MSEPDQDPQIDLPKKSLGWLKYIIFFFLILLLIAFVAKFASPSYWKIIWQESLDTTIDEAIEKFAFSTLVFFCLILVIHRYEGRKGVMAILKDALFSISATLLASIIFFCAHFYLIIPAKRDAAKPSEQNSPSDILTAQLATAKNDAQREKNRADQAEKKSEDFSALVKEMNNPSSQRPTSESIEDFRIKWDQNWQKDRTNAPNDFKQLIYRNTTELVKHNVEQEALRKLAQQAKAIELLKRAYPIWSVTVSKFKERLSEPAKRFGGEVLGGEVPPISEIMSNGVKNTFITFRSNSLWKCRCEFKNQGDFNLDCQENGAVRSFLGTSSSDDSLSIKLRHIESGGDFVVFATNCPISSLESCVDNLDTALQILIQDQDGQFERN